jgi:hypothetical protein
LLQQEAWSSQCRWIPKTFDSSTCIVGAYFHSKKCIVWDKLKFMQEHWIFSWTCLLYISFILIKSKMYFHRYFRFSCSLRSVMWCFHRLLCFF